MKAKEFYNAAIYLRLSRDDEDIDGNKSETLSGKMVCQCNKAHGKSRKGLLNQPPGFYIISSQSGQILYYHTVYDYAADIVKKIFAWKIEGYSNLAIAKRLDEMGILSPMEYKKLRGEKFQTSFVTFWVEQIKATVSLPLYLFMRRVIGSIQSPQNNRPA